MKQQKPSSCLSDVNTGREWFTCTGEQQISSSGVTEGCIFKTNRSTDLIQSAVTQMALDLMASPYLITVRTALRDLSKKVMLFHIRDWLLEMEGEKQTTTPVIDI